LFSFVGSGLREREGDGETRDGPAAMLRERQTRREETLSLSLAIAFSQARCRFRSLLIYSLAPASMSLRENRGAAASVQAKKRGKASSSMLRRRRFVFSFFLLSFVRSPTPQAPASEEVRTRKTSCSMERCPLVKRGMKRVAFPPESNEREREREREREEWKTAKKKTEGKKTLSRPRPLLPSLLSLPIALAPSRGLGVHSKSSCLFTRTTNKGKHAQNSPTVHHISPPNPPDPR